MAFDYSSLVDTATSLISDFGRNVSLVIETNSGTAYEPIITSTTSTIKAVVTSFKAGEVDGTIVQENDKKIITYSEITAQNKITDNGITYSIISVDTVQTGDTKIIFKGHLRQ